MDRKIQLELVRPKPSAPDTNTETRYRVLFEGEAIGVWRDPECSAARWLIDYGRATRDDTLRTYRGDTPCLVGSVGWFADHRVRENDTNNSGTPHFVKWQPNPFAVIARSGQKPASGDEGVGEA
jgi:hypothetical protein